MDTASSVPVEEARPVEGKKRQTPINHASVFDGNFLYMLMMLAQQQLDYNDSKDAELVGFDLMATADTDGHVPEMTTRHADVLRLYDSGVSPMEDYSSEFAQADLQPEQTDAAGEQCA